MAQQVLTHLQYSHDWVVVDSPPAFTEVVLRTFDMADEFVLLTTLDMPAIKNLKVTMDTLDALAMPRDKWHVLVNRSDARMGLTVEDVEKAIGLSVNNKIASSNDVPMSINSGEILFLSKPKHVVSRQIAQLASDVTEKYSKAVESEKPGLLARVRGAR
jgi:pilus assembly protein CpaE